MTRDDPERQRRLAALDQFRAETNRRFFERDCAAAGADPDWGASPSLLKALEAQGYAMPKQREDAA